MLMRAARCDPRVGPVLNIMTNPSFERAVAGAVAVRKNLAAYNTRAQTAAFNLAVNNASGLSDNRWFGPSGAGTRERFASGGPTVDLQAFLRKTWTTVPTSRGVDVGPSLTRGFGAGTVSAIGGIPVTAGRTYTISVYSRYSEDRFCSIRVNFKDASGNPVVNNLDGSVIRPAAGTWARPTLTVTAPVTGFMEAIEYDNPVNTQSVGTYLDMTGLLIEERPGILPYFDGATTDNSGIAYAWDGTAGASSSSARAATAEVRKNFCFRPLGPASPINTITGYSAVNGAAVSADPSNVGVIVDCSGGTVTDAGLSLNGVIADPGIVTVTASMDVTGITAGAWKVSAQGPWVSGNTSSAYVAVGVGETKRLSLTFTTIATGVSRALYLLRGPTAGGSEKARVSKVLLEIQPVALPFFDGTVTPDADLTPSWQNTADSTTSILSGVHLGLQAYGGTPIRSYGDGVTPASARFISRTNAASAEAMFFAFGGFSSLILAPGKTYTILAKVRLSAPLTATDSRSLRVWLRWSGTVNGSSASTAAPNAAGSTVLRLVATVPSSGVVGTMVQLNHWAAAGGGDTYWDEVAIIEGVYTGPYLDGDMPNCVWRGTPHASPSVGYPASVA